MSTPLNNYMARTFVFMLVASMVFGACQDYRNLDPCEGNTCSGRGSCYVSNDETICACDEGYSGDLCGECREGYHDEDGACVVNEVCETDSCSGHGTCGDSTGVVACDCDEAYEGNQCESCAPGYQDNDGGGTCLPDCSTQDCSGHGICYDSGGTTICACDEGYTGALCDTCTAAYQDNDGNGTCLPDCTNQDCSGHGTCDDMSGEAVCICDAGWGGPGCSMEEGSTCGDGVLDDGEECDDGNLKGHDGCSSGCTVETPRWVQTTPGFSPPAHSGHALAYDSTRGRVVLFGGTIEGIGISNSTWDYNGVGWVEITPSASPPGRCFHAMAYDSMRDRMVIFGGVGHNGRYLFDTWEFDGFVWAETTPSDSPFARWYHALTFDGERETTILFGGKRWGSGGLTDTWEYDGVRWVEKTTDVSPSAYYGEHAMVYDAGREKVVLFYQTSWCSETWEYDGYAWMETTPGNSPHGGMGYALAYYAARGKVVFFGGSGNGDSVRSDTWEYDGIQWFEIIPENSPPARKYHAMTYDALRRRVVLSGGEAWGEAFSDTWEYCWDSEWPDESCDNEVDDDLDGLTDCYDPDCEGLSCEG